MSEAYQKAPKFQLSKFLGKNKEYQIVIRTETAEDLIASMKAVKGLVDGIDQKVEAAPQPKNLQGHCDMHGVDMEEKEGKFGPYWSHYFKDEQGNGFYCNGKKITPAKKPTYKEGWN